MAAGGGPEVHLGLQMPSGILQPCMCPPHRWDASLPVRPQHLLEAGGVEHNENQTDGSAKKSAPFVLLLTA